MNEQLLEKAKKYYLDNNVTLREIAEESRNLFGTAMTYDTLRWHAMKGQWSVLKRRSMMGKNGLPDTQQDAMADIANVAYSAIMDADDPPNGRELAGLVSAFLNLVQKGVVSAGESAKTDMQQVLDMIKKHASSNTPDS
jgi:hypothetical protein